MIAALFVERDGVYSKIPDVDPWDVERDARKYDGPHAVVAHPPCERWGKYWFGGPSCKVRKIKGDDGGCFAAAIASVRKWGGVLEHPAASAAWKAHGLTPPPGSGAWVSAGMFDGGWTCQVEQGNYGHRARKATWLYAVGADLPSLNWKPSIATLAIDAGYHSKEERREMRSRGVRTKNDALERMGKRELLATPPAFAALMVEIARSVKRGDSETALNRGPGA